MGRARGHARTDATRSPKCSGIVNRLYMSTVLRKPRLRRAQLRASHAGGVKRRPGGLQSTIARSECRLARSRRTRSCGPCARPASRVGAFSGNRTRTQPRCSQWSLLGIPAECLADAARRCASSCMVGSRWTDDMAEHPFDPAPTPVVPARCQVTPRTERPEWRWSCQGDHSGGVVGRGDPLQERHRLPRRTDRRYRSCTSCSKGRQRHGATELQQAPVLSAAAPAARHVLCRSEGARR